MQQYFHNGVQIYFVRKDIRWKPLIRIAVRYCVASLAMFGVCILIKLAIHKPVITILIQMVMGVCTYIGMLVLFRDRFLNTVLERIKGKVSEFKLRFQN